MLQRLECDQEEISQNKYVLMKTIGKMVINILSKREEEILLKFFSD